MFLLPTIVGFLYEFFFAIPILSDIVTWGTGFATITTALIIHCVILAFRFATGDSKAVPILAIIGTLFTWIPIVSWFVHGFIALAYFIDLFTGRRSRRAS